jgi:integrating conjugative element protein (TIGR03756 family)
MAPKTLIHSLSAIILLVQTSSSWSKPINTSQIVSQTLSAMQCIQYNPVAGICFWLYCTPFGCKIKTSTKVKHWNPDVVVSSYTTPGESTWLESRSYSSGTPWLTLTDDSKDDYKGNEDRYIQYEPPEDLDGDGIADTTGNTDYFDAGSPPVYTNTAGNLPAVGGGDDTNSRQKKRQHTSTAFREVDAIGNPALFLTWMFSSTGYMCPSVTYPYVPHHLSGAWDAFSWRYATIEMLYPAALIPGMREIGSWPLNTWGNVYPRTGFVTQNEGPKASAVAAQRAGDIITRSYQPHIYWPLGDDCSRNNMKCWAPGPLKEMDSESGKWQMLAPIAENSCSIFGQNDVVKVKSWADNKLDQDEDFSWNLWRKYACCKKKGIFLYSIDY